MEFDAVVSNLRAVLLSTKGGVPIRKVMRDYKLIVGEPIQFKRMGFESLESFIRCVPGFRLIEVDGDLLLDAIPTEKTEHVAALVGNQRNSRKKSKPKYHTPYKPRVPQCKYKNLPKKPPPSRFQRPPVAPRFAAAVGKETSQFVSRDDNSNYASAGEDDHHIIETQPKEEETPEVASCENNANGESSLNDELSHLCLQEHSKNGVLEDISDLNGTLEADDDCVFMSRLAQLTSQINSSHPDRNLNISVSPNTGVDDMPDVLSSRLAHFMPRRRSYETVSQESMFQGDRIPSTVNPRLLHLTSNLQKRESNSESIFSTGFDKSDSQIDCDEGNVFDTRLAYFTSKVCNKSSPLSFENDMIGRNQILNTHFGHFPSSNAQDLQSGSFLSKGFADHFLTGSGPSKDFRNTSLKSQTGPYRNGLNGQVLTPNVQNIFNKHSFELGVISTGILNMHVGNMHVAPQTNGVHTLQTPSPLYSYVSPVSQSDRNSTQTCIQNRQPTPSEAAVSHLSSGSLSPVSDVGGAQGIKNAKSSFKTHEMKPMQMRQRNGSSFSDNGSDDLRVTPDPSNFCENSLMLPELILPEEDIWDVFVLYAINTQEIWANIIGKEYSDAYDAMAQRMELYYTDHAKKTVSINIGALYAVQISGLWHRVRLEDIEDDKCYVFLLDHGSVQLCPPSSLCVLDQQFTGVPPQAVCLSLFGLEDYVDNEYVNNFMDDFTHKPFVAEVVHRDPDTSVLSVYLVDVSTGTDVMINDVLQKLVV